MAYNFDEKIDRTQTDSLKWDRYQGKDILPLWVADTDFAAPPGVLDALQSRIGHGVFGYTHPPQALYDAVLNHLETAFDWQVEPEWIVWLPGLVSGLNIACRAVGESGDDVLIPCPIYPPFRSAPRQAQRNVLTVPMRIINERWVIDFESLESMITERTRLMLFCNPHNPGGTVYRRDELEQLAYIAAKYDLIICSDEIHCDLILEPDLKHTPLASLNSDISHRTITLMAPSKTFNIAGLGCSFAIIPDQGLRNAFNRQRRGIVPDVNLLGYTAAQAAYETGDCWLREQLDYLRTNRDLLIKELNQLPGVKLRPIEATYLAWIDFSDTKIADLPARLEQVGLGLSPGKDFGDERFMRLNFGCTRATLEEALKRMRSVFEHSPSSRNLT